MGGISIWQLLIIAVIVVLLFGTKKLRGIGGDLGGAVKVSKRRWLKKTSQKKKTLTLNQRTWSNKKQLLQLKPKKTKSRRKECSISVLGAGINLCCCFSGIRS